MTKEYFGWSIDFIVTKSDQVACVVILMKMLPESSRHFSSAVLRTRFLTPFTKRKCCVGNTTVALRQRGLKLQWITPQNDEYRQLEKISQYLSQVAFIIQTETSICTGTSTKTVTVTIT